MEPPEPRPEPLSLGGRTVADQAYTAGTEIAALELPVATGGVAPVAYALTGVPVGLGFDPTTRTLSGTPAAGGDYALTYTATDAEGAAVSLRFAVTVLVVSEPPSFAIPSGLPSPQELAGEWSVRTERDRQRH